MMTHMAKMADVILVGSNNWIGVCCDGLICADIKYMIHMTSVDNERLPIPSKYLEITYSFFLTGRYAIK